MAPILKAKAQEGLGLGSSTALGVPWGTVGATGLIWRSLILVKTATAAKISVTKTAKNKTQFFLKLSIYQCHPSVGLKTMDETLKGPLLGMVN